MSSLHFRNQLSVRKKECHAVMLLTLHEHTHLEHYVVKVLALIAGCVRIPFTILKSLQQVLYSFNKNKDFTEKKKKRIVK